jgi:O-succinylbenzoic acid--CoA ligase
LVLLRAVLLGAPVVVHNRFDARAVARADARFTALVPTMLRRLLDLGAGVDRFRTILIGGAALPPDLRARAVDAQTTVVETYGLTETCGGVVYDGRALERTEVRIGDAGIELRGPTLVRAYRLDPERTAAASAADGWLRTGDAGELDAAGMLRVSGRIDELINSGGEKIWPQEVETALETHDGVQEAAVAGADDPVWGQRVVAFVVARDRARPPTLAELRDHVSATIPRFKAPRELVLVDSLPRTASGKISRTSLRAPR